MLNADLFVCALWLSILLIGGSFGALASALIGRMLKEKTAWWEWVLPPAMMGTGCVLLYNLIY